MTEAATRRRRPSEFYPEKEVRILKLPRQTNFTDNTIPQAYTVHTKFNQTEKWHGTESHLAEPSE